MKAIVAMAENRVIGHEGKIPWHLPEDLKFFKKTTLGKVIVMGRKTYESIGHPLPGRKNVVLSRKKGKSMPGICCMSDPQTVLHSFERSEIFVIGGEAIYRVFLPFCDEILVTHVKDSPEGDTFFPAFEADFKVNIILQEDSHMKIVRYTRTS